MSKDVKTKARLEIELVDGKHLSVKCTSTDPDITLKTESDVFYIVVGALKWLNLPIETINGADVP